jgi:hypothetical protein
VLMQPLHSLLRNKYLSSSAATVVPRTRPGGAARLDQRYLHHR